MTIRLPGYFLQKSRGLDFLDDTNVGWTFDPATNEITATIWVTTAVVADAAVTNAKLADMAQATIKGRAVGAGTGVPVDLTGTQAAAIVNAYINHALLLNLGVGNDHPQYPLKAGVETIGGSWTFSLTPVVPDQSWTYAKLQNATARSLLGRASGTAGVLADIAASADGQVPLRTAGAIVFTAPTAPAAGLTISTTLTFALANDLAALEALASTGFAARTTTDTWAQRTLTAPAAGFTITNPAGVAGDPIFVLANDLSALEGLGSTGIAARTATDTWAQRTLTAPAAGFTITNPAGVAGDPTFVLANDLSALEGLGSTGIAVRTTTDTWAQRTLQAPAAGFTITNPAGVAGDPTYVLANDLSALEGLGSTGIAVRTTTDTWAQRTITNVANRTTITNGDGVSGNPTVDISATYVGQASITTLGTITTGVWTGTAVAAINGGTGLTAYTLGDLPYSSATNTLAALAGNVTTTKKFLTQTGNGSISAAPGWNTIIAGDIQTLACTWSAQQIYTNASDLIIQYKNLGGAANEKLVLHRTAGTSYSISFCDDTVNNLRAIMSASRSANAVTAITVGNATDNQTFGVLGTGLATFSGQVAIGTVGKGLSVKEGTNAKMGTATMVAGTVAVSTTAVTATSRVFLTIQSLGTVAAPKAIGVTARTAGTSFTITSADATDTSVVAWMLVESA